MKTRLLSWGVILLGVIFLLISILLANGVPDRLGFPLASDKVSLCPPPAAEGPGVYAGNEAAPWAEMQGVVMKVIDPNPPIELEQTTIPVRFVKVYYSGIVVATGLVQPVEGEVEKLYIGSKNVELSSTDFSSGCIQTKEYGSMPILFSANVYNFYGMIVMTEDQLKNFK